MASKVSRVRWSPGAETLFQDYYQPSSCWMFQQGLKMCQGLFKVEINVGPLQRRHMARILQKRESLMAGGVNTNLFAWLLFILSADNVFLRFLLTAEAARTRQIKNPPKLAECDFKSLGEAFKTERAKMHWNKPKSEILYISPPKQ